MNFTVFIFILSFFNTTTINTINNTTINTINNTTINTINNITNSSNVTDQCRYADPYQEMCRSDEINVTIKYKNLHQTICTIKCDFNSDCPQDTCSNITSKPECILEDEFGEKYCGLNCDENDTCSIDEYMVCMETPKNKGFCAYLK